uniref:Histone deacetylase complex subunit SAP18 n=1 Tax=Triticum urartu TaxID=4572 RepID=A0A8R7QPI0_TRIUA
MAGMGEMSMRPRPGPPMHRGPPPMARPRPEPIDREKTCPLLLRVFTKVGGHHLNEEFSERGKEPKDEVQIYTWKDATLRELTDLVKEVALPARKRNARLSFAFVYPDKNGRFVVKQVGSTFSYGHGRGDDAKSLGDLGFQVCTSAALCYSILFFLVGTYCYLLCYLGLQIGDYLSVSIM